MTSLLGVKFFFQGRSSGNQGIEAWWSKLREGGGGWWINLFKDLRNSGNFDETRVHKECLKFCFLPLLHQELYLVAELWNTHNIQAQKRLEVHCGKPDIMYFTPEVYNSQNYLITVDVENVNACKEGLNGGGGSSIANFYGPLLCFVLCHIGDSGKIVIFAIFAKFAIMFSFSRIMSLNN